MGCGRETNREITSGERNESSDGWRGEERGRRRACSGVEWKTGNNERVSQWEKRGRRERESCERERRRSRGGLRVESRKERNVCEGKAIINQRQSLTKEKRCRGGETETQRGGGVSERVWALKLGGWPNKCGRREESRTRERREGQSINQSNTQANQSINRSGAIGVHRGDGVCNNRAEGRGRRKRYGQADGRQSGREEEGRENWDDDGERGHTESWRETETERQRGHHSVRKHCWSEALTVYNSGRRD
jgi:hypothetical protein